ncbi:MAG: ParB/RepB/Spo0J family partition protein [Clostridia bacterium]|nr:ParB/RepB/Spo0J family partition protein [Clostridia bacterium]
MAKKGLGKGLDALFAEEEDKQGVLEVKLTDVMPNKNQPRKSFDEEKLAALSESIKEHGLIQPIVVTKNAEGYTIVAGERRWRAAKKAGIKKIPVIVKDYDDLAVREIALIENLQREDLNPIEEAMGYRALMDEYNLTQEEISTKLGKSRSAIANSVRLLTLDEDIQKKLIAGEITEGHARCALSVPAGVVREFFVNRIIQDGLNVRQAELLAKDLAKTPTPKSKKQQNTAYKIELERISRSLEQFLGTKVKLSGTSKKGKIEIEYYGNEDLERLLELIKRG